MRSKTTKKRRFFFFLPQRKIATRLLAVQEPVGSLFSLCARALLGTPATGELGMLSYAGSEVPASCAWDISEREAGGRTRFN